MPYKKNHNTNNLLPSFDNGANLSYSSILDQTEECIITADKDFNIQEINEEVTKLTNYTVDELKGKNLAEIFDNRSYEIIQAVVSGCQKAIRQSNYYQLRLKNKTGSSELLASKMMVVPSINKSSLIIITAQPVVNTLFNSLYYNLLNGIAILLAESNENTTYLRFIGVNNSFEKLTGISNDSVINKKLYDVFPGNAQEWYNLYLKCKQVNRNITLENYSVLCNRYLSISGFCHSENIFIMVFDDLTSQKKH